MKQSDTSFSWQNLRYQSPTLRTRSAELRLRDSYACRCRRRCSVKKDAGEGAEQGVSDKVEQRWVPLLVPPLFYGHGGATIQVQPVSAIGTGLTRSIRGRRSAKVVTNLRTRRTLSPATTTTFLERYVSNLERVASRFDNGRHSWNSFLGTKSQVALAV